MRTFFLFLCTLFFSLLAGELQRENIPLFEKNASQVILFAIQKDFSNGSLKSKFLKELQSYFGIEVFIETGTHLGNTAQKASEIFTTIHTIEVFPEFYSLAKERFKNKENVHVHFGSSGDVLSSILPLCQQKVLFYLDGHYDGGDRSGKGEKNTPILEELAAIRSWGRTDAVILIDDICDFQESLYPDRIQQTCFADYPDLNTLIEGILAIHPHYQICFIPNALLVFPPNAEVTVSPILSACTIDHLSAISDLFSEKELLEAEKAIGCAQGPELNELKHYFHAYAEFEWEFGWRSFAGFWMGLILSHEQKHSRANQLLKQTAKNSLPGWRIDAYICK